jgi:hypothetical protein
MWILLHNRLHSQSGPLLHLLPPAEVRPREER